MEVVPRIGGFALRRPDLPRVLGPRLYGEKFKQGRRVQLRGDVDGKDHDKYLWMNAAWAYAARITDAFAKYGWMARTRGVEGGGKVEGLPVHTFPTDDGDVAMKCPTEIAITDRREFELSNLGFLPLLHSKGRDFAVFMRRPVVPEAARPTSTRRPTPTPSSRPSSTTSCASSRFAHYLKVMARDKIGSFMERGDMEKWLNGWINNYVLGNPENGRRARQGQKPLAEAEIKVQDVPGQPGSYEAVAYLRPHFQLESLDISLRMVAKQLGQG